MQSETATSAGEGREGKEHKSGDGRDVRPGAGPGMPRKHERAKSAKNTGNRPEGHKAE